MHPSPSGFECGRGVRVDFFKRGSGLQTNVRNCTYTPLLVYYIFNMYTHDICTCIYILLYPYSFTHTYPHTRLHVHFYMQPSGLISLDALHAHFVLLRYASGLLCGPRTKISEGREEVVWCVDGSRFDSHQERPLRFGTAKRPAFAGNEQPKTQDHFFQGLAH